MVSFRQNNTTKSKWAVEENAKKLEIQPSDTTIYLQKKVKKARKGNSPTLHDLIQRMPYDLGRLSSADENENENDADQKSFAVGDLQQNSIQQLSH